MPGVALVWRGIDSLAEQLNHGGAAESVIIKINGSACSPTVARRKTQLHKSRVLRLESKRCATGNSREIIIIRFSLFGLRNRKWSCTDILNSNRMDSVLLRAKKNFSEINNLPDYLNTRLNALSVNILHYCIALGYNDYLRIKITGFCGLENHFGRCRASHRYFKREMIRSQQKQT